MDDMRTRILVSTLVLVVFLLHQDFWNWTKTEPLLLGFLPPGLAYHAGYCFVAALLMAVVVRYSWPRSLDEVESSHEKASKKGER
jgi:hypothetical protein